MFLCWPPMLTDLPGSSVKWKIKLTDRKERLSDIVTEYSKRKEKEKEKEYLRRINTTTPRRTRQSSEGSKSHPKIHYISAQGPFPQITIIPYLRCINRFPLFNSTYRRPTPKVHGNQIRLLNRLAQELCNGAENKRVADTMESVLPKGFLPRQVLVDWVRFDIVRQCVVEGCVEIRDAFDFGEFLFACSDDF